MSDDENSNAQVSGEASGNAGARIKPIVLKYKKMKKESAAADKQSNESKPDGSKKYSRGLQNIQEMEGNVVRVAQKASKAVSTGIDVYGREREKSANEKTDGAIEDFINNSAKAGSAFLKEASDIPVDLAESISTSGYRKQVRKNLKRASKLLRLWRI